MAKFVNITPHEVTVRRAEGEPITILPSGTVARVATSPKVVAVVDGINITSTTFGEVHDLPDPQEGVVYIASLLVAQAAARAGRMDVLAPGPLIRDEEGRPIGCEGLSLPSDSPSLEKLRHLLSIDAHHSSPSASAMALEMDC
jgi:hypothetical protein